MPAARFWRLVGIETRVRLADLELSELALYEGASRVDSSATLTSTFAPTVGTLANLSDADTGTTTRFGGTDVACAGFEIRWDFGVGITKDISELRIGAGSSSLTFIYAFELAYSSDGSSWTFFIGDQGAAYPGDGLELVCTNGDPNYYDNVLLLHGEGANGGTSFVDNSPTPKTVTRTGTGQTSTVQKKFGNSSLYLVSTDRVVVSPSANFAMSGNFTIEFFFLSTDASAEVVVLSLDSGGAVGDFTLRLKTTNILSANFNVFGQSSAGPSNDVFMDGLWHHIAVVRVGVNIYFYMDGILAGSPLIYSGMVGNSGGTLRIGSAQNTPTSRYTGYVDELRITKDHARYTANFTPPTVAFLDKGYFTTAPVTRLLALGESKPTTVNKQAISTGGAVAPGQSGLADPNDAGLYRVSGTVKEKALPSNTPLKRKVRLFIEQDGRLIRETWSDAVTGAYTFDYIRGDYKYTVVSYDYANNYRAVIADNVTPDLIV